MSTHYLVHLLVWALPVLGAQWAVFARLLACNARAIAGSTLVVASYLSVVDHFAIGSHVWFFDARHLVGFHVGNVPVEEVLFFVLTSLLVTQSMVLFLPRRLKHVPATGPAWKSNGLPF